MLIPLETASTKNILKVVEIPEEVILYIQKLNYEAEGYKAINKTILTGTGEFMYNRDVYSLHMQNFQKAQAEFKMAMQMLQEEYAADLVNDDNLELSVDFIKYTVTFFNYNKGGHSC